MIWGGQISATHTPRVQWAYQISNTVVANEIVKTALGVDFQDVQDIDESVPDISYTIGEGSGRVAIDPFGGSSPSLPGFLIGEVEDLDAEVCEAWRARSVSIECCESAKSRRNLDSVPSEA